MWERNLGEGLRVCKAQGERGKARMTEAAFAARVIAMQDTLYRVSTTILPRLCDREDAVQSAIEKALRKRGRLRDEAALEKWLTRILINECYTIHRRRRREVLCGDPAARETAPDADRDLYRLFTSLPEAYRLPMVLHYVEGYAVSEVAQMLRLGVNTVKSRLLRGRRLLGAALEEGEEA